MLIAHFIRIAATCSKDNVTGPNSEVLEIGYNGLGVPQTTPTIKIWR